MAAGSSVATASGAVSTAAGGSSPAASGAGGSAEGCSTGAISTFSTTAAVSVGASSVAAGSGSWDCAGEGNAAFSSAIFWDSASTACFCSSASTDPIISSSAVLFCAFSSPCKALATISSAMRCPPSVCASMSCATVVLFSCANLMRLFWASSSNACIEVSETSARAEASDCAGGLSMSVQRSLMSSAVCTV